MHYPSWKKLYMPKGRSISGLRVYCLAYLLISFFCLPFLFRRLIYWDNYEGILWEGWDMSLNTVV